MIESVKNIIQSLSHFEVVTVNRILINEAIECSMINELSFWDALIVVSAESARCKTLWTEDLSHGHIIRGVTAENPLRQ